MFCPNCGTQNAVGAGFCAKCGARLEATQPAPQPVQPAPQPVSQSTYQQPVQAPAQPAYSRPAYDKPHTYRSSYNVRGSFLSWVTLVAALAGVIGCFLPMAAGRSDSSIFNGLKVAFSSDAPGAQKWLVLYPSAFIIMAIVALLLGLNAVRRRPGWLGIVSLFSGVATTLGAIVFLGAKSEGANWGDFGIGMYMAVIASAVCLLITLVQLFAEGD